MSDVQEVKACKKHSIVFTKESNCDICRAYEDRERETTTEHEFFHYAHMCRDGHEQIGHNDSESEICPVCREIAQGERAIQEAVASVEANTIMRFRKMLDRLGIHSYYSEMQKEFEGDPLVALDSLIEAAIEAGVQWQCEHKQWEATIGARAYGHEFPEPPRPTPASIREGKRGQDG